MITALALIEIAKIIGALTLFVAVTATVWE